MEKYTSRPTGQVSIDIADIEDVGDSRNLALQEILVAQQQKAREQFTFGGAFGKEMKNMNKQLSGFYKEYLTYEKIKEIGVNQMFPHWLKKNGANNMRKLQSYRSWGFDQMIKELVRLDSKLKDMRSIGEVLNGPDATVQGKAFIENILNLSFL